MEEFGDELDQNLLIRKPFRMAELDARIDHALAQPVSTDERVVSLDQARRRRDSD